MHSTSRRNPYSHRPGIRIHNFPERFGHEEWLFNFAWVIDGFHYAFLQPVNRSFRNVTGKTIEILLYTVNPDGNRLYVGKIAKCEVLDVAQARMAVKAYRKLGWLRSMAEQVGTIGGSVEHVTNDSKAIHLFNVRFRPEDAEVYARSLRQRLRVAPRN